MPIVNWFLLCLEETCYSDVDGCLSYADVLPILNFHNFPLRIMQFAALHYRSVEWSPCRFAIPFHWENVKTRSDLCSVEWASTLIRHCQPDTLYDKKMSNGHWKSIEFTWTSQYFNVEWPPFLWLCMNPTTTPIHYKYRTLTFFWRILKSHLVCVVRNSSLP